MNLSKFKKLASAAALFGAMFFMVGCGGGGDSGVTPPSTYTLTTYVNPAAGGIVSPAGISTHDAGASVTVTASALPEYTFTGWSGASTSTSDQVTIVMNGDKILTANFQHSTMPTTYFVVVTGGTGGGSFEAGATVEITAAVPANQRFANWTASPSVTFEDANSSTTSFTMPANAVTVTANFKPVGIPGEPLVDPRDNNVYRTVTIGSQTWMAENLNYVDPAWSGNDVTNFVRIGDKGSWCYGNEPDSCNVYGRLYTWDAAIVACPVGWHLPDLTELLALFNAIGSSTAGKELKSTSGWYMSSLDWDISGTDEYGFSALPGGHRTSDAYFYAVGSGGYWWIANESGNDATIWYTGLITADGVSFATGPKNYAHSVRCIKD